MIKRNSDASYDCPPSAIVKTNFLFEYLPIFWICDHIGVTLYQFKKGSEPFTVRASRLAGVIDWLLLLLEGWLHDLLLLVVLLGGHLLLILHVLRLCLLILDRRLVVLWRRLILGLLVHGLGELRLLLLILILMLYWLRKTKACSISRLILTIIEGSIRIVINLRLIVCKYPTESTALFGCR